MAFAPRSPMGVTTVVEWSQHVACRVPPTRLPASGHVKLLGAFEAKEGRQPFRYDVHPSRKCGDAIGPGHANLAFKGTSRRV